MNISQKCYNQPRSPLHHHVVVRSDDHREIVSRLNIFHEKGGTCAVSYYINNNNK